MPQAQAPIRQVYVVVEEGWFYGSWKKPGDQMTLYPIQAHSYVERGAMRLAESADAKTKPVKPAPTTDRPTNTSRRVSSATDPGLVNVVPPAPNPMPETEVKTPAPASTAGKP